MLWKPWNQALTKNSKYTNNNNKKQIQQVSGRKIFTLVYNTLEKP